MRVALRTPHESLFVTCRTGPRGSCRLDFQAIEEDGDVMLQHPCDPPTPTASDGRAGMNDKPPYRKWVGVILGLILSGSAHFLSGRRSAGVKWYFGILLSALFAAFAIAIPGTLAYVLCLVFIFVSFALSIIMLTQSYSPVPRMGYMRWVAVVAIGICLNYASSTAIRAFVQPFNTPTGSMSPTIMRGDHIVVEKLSYRFQNPERGDVIVFKTDGICPSLPANRYYIKRLAGIPGDRIRIEPPNLIVNGQIMTNPPVFNRISSTKPPYSGYRCAPAGDFPRSCLGAATNEIYLGVNEYFLLGDNTRTSLDSRYFGPIARKSIVGKATRIYWPLGRTGQLLGGE